MAGFERLAAERGLWIVEDTCEALGAVHADGTLAGARGNLAVFAFYANKQLTTGEGGHGHQPVAGGARRGSTPSATRAARPTWAGSTTTGSASTTGCPTSPARSASRSSSGWTTCSPAASAWPALYADALGGIEGLELPAAHGPAAPPSGRGSSTWSSCRTASTATATIEALRERGIDAKPYLPAIHLYGFYRERFGHREGEFPNAEDAARRCLALPFFPGLSESEVAQVAEALTRRARRATPVA